jgi:hypothetical protein
MGFESLKVIKYTVPRTLSKEDECVSNPFPLEE